MSGATSAADAHQHGAHHCRTLRLTDGVLSLTCSEGRRGRGHGVGQVGRAHFQRVPGRKPRRSSGRDARARTLRDSHVGGAGGLSANARESGEMRLDDARGVRAEREVRFGARCHLTKVRHGKYGRVFRGAGGRARGVLERTAAPPTLLCLSPPLSLRRVNTARVARLYALLQYDGHRHCRRARRWLALRRPRRGRRRALLLGRRAHGAQGVSRSPSPFDASIAFGPRHAHPAVLAAPAPDHPSPTYHRTPHGVTILG